jgi:hypothetical protein
MCLVTSGDENFALGKTILRIKRDFLGGWGGYYDYMDFLAFLFKIKSPPHTT